MAKKKKTKPKTKSIVIGHLENISSGIFARFKTEIVQMIQGNFGIYALYKKNHLYYIGLATNFKQRLTQHLKDRHSYKWDTFSLYIVRKQDHIHLRRCPKCQKGKPGLALFTTEPVEAQRIAISG